tara:strand:- start:150 stop:1655 length:1506 start_codon:yes stop_codon:yes gene_type:complete
MGKKDTLNALLRSRLEPTIRKTFETLNTGGRFLPNWHIEALAYMLECCERREIKRLIVSMPPRYLKSEICSVAFPAWLLGRDPSARIITVSYSEDLARHFGRARQKVMEMDWYLSAFPIARSSLRKNTESEIVTPAGGGCYATSVGGTLTGRGGNFILIDDPIKVGGAMSRAERNAVNEWYRHTLFTRLNDKKNDVIIIVMQRAHVDDLAGYVRELDDWEVLDLPAIADEEVWIETGPNPKDRYHRLPGEPLHPEREDVDTLEAIKRTIGAYSFSSQYQQRPIPITGNLIKREWLKRVDKAPNYYDCDAVYQSWDTATGTETSNSYSVCTTWGVRLGKYYLLHVFRERIEVPDLLEAIKSLAEKFHPRVVLIEDTSSGATLRHLVKLPKGISLIPVKPPRMDKETRLSLAAPTFESGSVVIPTDQPWSADYEEELLSFPGSRFNDQADSTSQFFLWILDPQGGHREFSVASSAGISVRGGRYTTSRPRKYHPMRDPKKRWR